MFQEINAWNCTLGKHTRMNKTEQNFNPANAVYGTVHLGQPNRDRMVKIK